jgi:hypothetical protein
MDAKARKIPRLQRPLAKSMALYERTGRLRLGFGIVAAMLGVTERVLDLLMKTNSSFVRF